MKLTSPNSKKIQSKRRRKTKISGMKLR